MSVIQIVDSFPQALGRGRHNFETSVYKVALTNQAFSASWETLADVTEIAAQTTGTPPEPTGYTTGGNVAAYVSDDVTDGVYRPILADPADWSAGTNAEMGPFRTAVLYNSTSTAKEIVGAWDRGTSLTLAIAGDPFRVDMSQFNGILTIQVAAS